MIELKTCPVCKSQVPAVYDEATGKWVLVDHYLTSAAVLWKCPGTTA